MASAVGRFGARNPDTFGPSIPDPGGSAAGHAKSLQVKCFDVLSTKFAEYQTKLFELELDSEFAIDEDNTVAHILAIKKIATLTSILAKMRIQLDEFCRPVMPPTSAAPEVPDVNLTSFIPPNATAIPTAVNVPTIPVVAIDERALSPTSFAEDCVTCVLQKKSHLLTASIARPAVLNELRPFVATDLDQFPAVKNNARNQGNRHRKDPDPDPDGIVTTPIPHCVNPPDVVPPGPPIHIAFALLADLNILSYSFVFIILNYSVARVLVFVFFVLVFVFFVCVFLLECCVFVECVVGVGVRVYVCAI